MRELYTSRLAQVIRSPDSPSISAAFDIKIQEYFAGKLPHAKDLVLGLFDLLTSNRIPSHPSPPESPHSTMIPYSNVNDGSWIQLRDAITRSLMTGIFLDSMFYVEDSTELRPLFFCSSIAPTSLKKISGQYKRDLLSVGLPENEQTEIGKLVSMSSLHGGSERVILGCGNAIVSQDTTSQKVFVVTSGDLRTQVTRTLLGCFHDLTSGHVVGNQSSGTCTQQRLRSPPFNHPDFLLSPAVHQTLGSRMRVLI